MSDRSNLAHQILVELASIRKRLAAVEKAVEDRIGNKQRHARVKIDQLEREVRRLQAELEHLRGIPLMIEMIGDKVLGRNH